MAGCTVVALSREVTFQNFSAITISRKTLARFFGGDDRRGRNTIKRKVNGERVVPV
jgi:hypothetical protein